MYKSHTHQLKALGYLPKVDLQDVDKIATDITDEGFQDAFANRLCGHPDYPDEEIADSDTGLLTGHLGMEQEDAECLKKCHGAMVARATGRGSWPYGCHPDLYPNNHCVKYYVLRDTFPAKHKRIVSTEDLDRLIGPIWGSKERIYDLYNGKTMLDVGLMLSDETYRRRGCAHIETETRSEAQLVIRSRYISGSTIGIGWFNDGTCRDQVEYHIDNSWNAGLHPYTGLLAHECGHTNDLQHTFSGQSTHHGIMSYSQTYPFEGYSDGSDKYRNPRDPAVSVLNRQYGDEPVPPLEPIPPIEPPPKPPPTGDFALSGVLVVEGIPHELYIKKEK